MLRTVFGIIACILFLSADGVAEDYADGLKAAQTGDFSTTLKKWRPLAQDGFALAQQGLGLMYRHGRGVKRNYVQAVRWYSKAAAQGLSKSQLDLGSMYASGQGVKRDFVKALTWFGKAAAQGSAAAKNNLAFMYRYGKGVPKDFGKALLWYLKAAAQGYGPALDNIGMLYANGRGVPRDYVEAHKWLSLASMFGSARGARYLKYIVKKMNTAQVAEAERLAREWIVDFKQRQNFSK